MKVDTPNPVNEILPGDSTRYPNVNHTFIGCHQTPQRCLFCLQVNGLFMSIKADTALRKCQCQPLIHLDCFRAYAANRQQFEEVVVPCLGCNGSARIRGPGDVILTAVYNLSGRDDEEMSHLFERWRKLYINFGNPAADDLHILEQAAQLHSEEARLKKALLEVRETRRALHIKPGRTRAKLRRAAKCYDRLSLAEQDAIVTKKLFTQLEMN
jgi:hypothetical protein